MMAGPLTVVSYNCRGFPKTPAKLWTKPTLSMLLQNEDVDIIALQETFLSKQDLSCLNVIHKDYHGVGTSTIDSRDKLVLGHPQGGVAILYWITKAKCITPLYFNLDWVVGVSVSSSSYNHVILCVYLKCASGNDDHKEIFQGQLEELKYIIDGLNTTSVSIIGDFNADVMNPSHQHGPLLSQFATECGLTITSKELLPCDSFTYVSDMRQGQTSWLDHCLSTQDGHGIVNDISIGYQMSCSDHIPVTIRFNLDNLPTVVDEFNNVNPKINWDKYDAIKLREFSLMCDINLGSIILPTEALNCRDVACRDENHINQTKLFYDNICKNLNDASSNVLGINKKGKFNCKPGFNDYVKDKHDLARRRFLAWKNANKPRDPNNQFFREMVVSYKLSLIRK